MKFPSLTLVLLATALLCSPVLAQGNQRGPGGPGVARTSPVMTAIDTDGDGALSAEEIKKATASLATLDKNQDDRIAGDELGAGAGGRGRARGPGGQAGPGGGPGGMQGGRGMGSSPLLTALDDDRDGELSAGERAEASSAIQSLDTDRDGSVAGAELMAPGAGGPGRPGGGRGGFGEGGGGGKRVEPEELKIEDGAASIADRTAFKVLSYQGSEVMIDTQLTGVEFVKFIVGDLDGETPKIWFMNTKTHRAHPMFAGRIGLARGRGGAMMGVLVYRPLLASPSGQQGLYTFEFEPNDAYPFARIQLVHDLLGQFAPMLVANLAYHPLPAAYQATERDRAEYEAAKLPVFFDDQLFADIAFLPMHIAEGFGRLRLMNGNERPGMQDIVLYRNVPPELPRVAGMITGERQTPLSHVNLRAVQDNVPNAYVRGAADLPAIQALLGKYVHYRVAADGYELHEATSAQVDAHFAGKRPTAAQAPTRDLSVTAIRPLRDVAFADASSIGTKAANLGALLDLGLQDGMVPDGFAVPFSFYDEFMRHNGFYGQVKTMLAEPAFATDVAAREQALATMRKKIAKGTMPASLQHALAKVQGTFAADAPIRCRSSTNNEDLPGFSGAGLYDSFTHKPGGRPLAATIQKVFASLWNFRAFEEREFYRIDHLATAMGVVLLPNYRAERVNGVAVTDDIAYQTGSTDGRRFYMNAQLGDDLVTNPRADSIPEERLLHPSNARRDTLIRHSNRVTDGKDLLSEEHLGELRKSLVIIHRKFRTLYGARVPFAMEIEWKVTADDKLAIKQARPWVF